MFPLFPIILSLSTRHGSSRIYPSTSEENLSLDYLEDVILKNSNEKYHSLLQRVDLEHDLDIQASGFAIEEEQTVDRNEKSMVHNRLPSYEHIVIEDHPLAIRSTESLLSRDERQAIIQAADQYWRQRQEREGETEIIIIIIAIYLSTSRELGSP